MSVAGRRVANRGSNVRVVAAGQALFAPGTDVSRWKNRFSNVLTAEVAKAAPVHGQTGRWAGRRTLRPHPGGHLKDSFTSATNTRITKGGGFFYIATGSNSPYALFVDQGTGPSEVKLLPPWSPGSPSLYEASWKPGGRQVAPVMSSGQKAQNFFDKGLRRAFQIMAERSVEVPGEGVSAVRGAMESFPESLADRALASRGQEYSPSLQAWRDWRDEAFRARKSLGEHTALTRYATNRLIAERARKQARVVSSEEKRLARKARRNAVKRAGRLKGKYKSAKNPRNRFTKDLEDSVRSRLNKYFKVKGVRTQNLGVFDDHTWAVQVWSNGQWVTRTGRW